MADPPPASDVPEVWDERYAGADEVWSGAPNGALVTEVANLTAGRAPDVGCGEGVEAIWLATEGWRVTALDVSRVAVERGRVLVARTGVEVDWVIAGWESATSDLWVFGLVSTHYPALRATPEGVAERALADAVGREGPCWSCTTRTSTRNGPGPTASTPTTTSHRRMSQRSWAWSGTSRSTRGGHLIRVVLRDLDRWPGGSRVRG